MQLTTPRRPARNWAHAGLLALFHASCAHSPPAPPPAAEQDAPPQAGQDAPVRIRYPSTPKSSVVDDYHGTKVADPYRWLEGLDSKETRAWVEAQNRVTFAYLGRIPARQRIRERLTELWNFEKYSPPFREGNLYFYTKNDGLQNQSVLYVTASLDAGAAPRVLLDPNTLSADGTVAMSGLAVSKDGRLLAYGLATAGSDWNEWHVRDIQTGKDLPDVVRWIKFSGVSFTSDGKGFYYSRFKEPAPGAQLEEVNYHQKLYYHRLGTAQESDELVYERPDQKEWQFEGEVTEDGRYLVITVAKGTNPRYRILYKDLKAPRSKVIALIDNFDAEYTFLGNDGAVFYFKTDIGAPRGKIIAVDLRKADPRAWRVLVPEVEEIIESASMVGDHFVVSYLKDARSQVKIFDLSGKLEREVPLPAIGTAVGFVGRRRDRETFYGFTSTTTPMSIYRYDLRSGESALLRKPRIAFDPDGYETEQVFYTSKDGTRVPMFLSHKKGIKRDGQNATYLYGYGGFNVSLKPKFSVSDLVFMEMGGVHAVANIRGGGEYGQAWHEAGTKLHKQRVFDDFIAAAEWLIGNGYTSAKKLAIGGGSNGGLLVGACMTQRPDLFAAALPAVGVMDMLRFHKFTIGWNWVDDYGSSDNPDEFKALYAYSPLHNIKEGTSYPATLITTADHDDRVVPAHSFKFAAALQAAQRGPQPILIRIETRAGHGAGKPTSKKIEEAADSLAFLSETLGLGAREAGGPASARR